MGFLSTSRFIVKHLKFFVNTIVVLVCAVQQNSIPFALTEDFL